MKTKEKRIRVGAVSPHLRVADVSYNVRECIKHAERAADRGVFVLAFPQLALTGATAGDLFRYSPLAQRAEEALKEYIDETASLDMVSLIGLPALVGEGLYNSVAAVYRGRMIGLFPGEGDGRYFNTPSDLCGKVEYAGQVVKVKRKPVLTLPRRMGKVSFWGSLFELSKSVDVAFCQLASEAMMYERRMDLLAAKTISEIGNNACVFVNAGVGESTTDAVYSAHNIISERGEILAEALPFAEDNLIVADVIADRRSPKDEKAELGERGYLNPMRTNPFLPADVEAQREVCLHAFEIQSRGLAARIERSYSRSMVIGVSGGLDSTLALLVCARAADILGMDRKNIISVTMPCFGTTSRTKSNAQKLSESLGVTFRTVDIKASVTQHLSDIGHDGVSTDVTYENAQARERTQVLMDIANMSGGLVVGTGDLSELVLGWATYNGDHMSMYAVNASVPKTMVRKIVEIYSERDKAEGGACCDILEDILSTPVSPELLPPKDGEIAQCTEELVGPYELHDFFIYYTLNGGFSPREIYDMAKKNFGGVYDNATILHWLGVFVRRFISQQFKRSCLPDGPKVSYISVSPRGALSMPSDASPAVWLEEIEKIKKEEK